MYLGPHIINIHKNICGYALYTFSEIYRAFISKNGTSTSVARADIRPGDSITFGSGFGENTPAVSAIVDLSASDTLRVIARIESGSGTLRVSDSSSNTASQFYAYKLTGI